MEEIAYCSDCTELVSPAEYRAGVSLCCDAEVWVDVEWITDPDELDLDDRF